MFDVDLLRRVLFEQRQAILQKSEGIERETLTNLEGKRDLPHAVIITGIRRCGKSTLLRQIIRKYYKDADFFFVNFEDERFYNFPAENFDQIYEIQVELFGACKTFFIDEIQNVVGFERFVRRFLDNGFKFFITGSNAQLLSRELGTKLTGRHVNVLLKPFSFREFLRARKIPANPAQTLDTITRVEIKKAFDDFLFHGGMPEFVFFQDPDLLSHIYEDIVVKDVAVRYHISNLRTLREVYAYLIANIGQKFSYNNLAKLVQLRSPNSLKKYSSYLEDTYFAFTIEKFDYSVKKQLVNDKKFYLLDNGFIPAISRKNMEDRGWLLENLVAAALYARGQVYYHAGKYECDFLVITKESVQQVIQVSYELTERNREREIQGLAECLRMVKGLEGVILTYNQAEELKINELSIHVMPMWAWLNAL